MIFWLYFLLPTLFPILHIYLFYFFHLWTLFYKTQNITGLGLGLTIGAMKSATGILVLHPDNMETISFVTLLISVVSAGIIVPLSGFKYTKPFAIALLVLYFVFLVLGILAAAEIFKF